MAQIIEYRNVDIYQKEQIVLKGVSLTVQTGQFYYLIGKVGSGKSSLLKTMYAELPLYGDATVLDYKLSTIKEKEIPFLKLFENDQRRTFVRLRVLYYNFVKFSSKNFVRTK